MMHGWAFMGMGLFLRMECSRGGVEEGRPRSDNFRGLSVRRSKSGMFHFRNFIKKGGGGIFFF